MDMSKSSKSVKSTMGAAHDIHYFFTDEREKDLRPCNLSKYVNKNLSFNATVLNVTVLILLDINIVVVYLPDYISTRAHYSRHL